MDEACKIAEIIDRIIKMRYIITNCQNTNTVLRQAILKLSENEECNENQRQSSAQRKNKDEVREWNESEKTSFKQSNSESRAVFRDFQNYEKMLAERIRENISLKELNTKLQKECKMKERKISELTRKISLKLTEVEKKKIEAIKISEYKEIIGDKNIELQRLSRELEIEKRRVERGQLKIKRMLKLEQMKEKQAERLKTHCSALQLERQLKELQDNRDKLVQELEIKTEECNSAFSYITVLEEDSACLKSELHTLRQKENNQTHLFNEAVKELKDICEVNKFIQCQCSSVFSNCDVPGGNLDKSVQVNMKLNPNEQQGEGIHSNTLLDLLPISKCCASVPEIGGSESVRPASRSSSNFVNSKVKLVKMKNGRITKKRSKTKLQLRSVEEEMAKTRNILVTRLCDLEERINTIPLDAIAKCFSQDMKGNV